MKLNIDELVRIVQNSNIDITTNFNDWTKVAFALASEYGEDGRQYFHSLAKMSPNYKFGENEKKYDNAIRTGKKTSISTLVYICKNNHIDVSPAYIKELCDIEQDYVFVPAIKEDKFNQESFTGMSTEWVDKAHSFAPESTLYKGLTNLSILKNKAVVGDIFDEYKVGALPDHSTSIFWQIDIENKIRNGKTIPYKDNLHRDKDRGANWIHSLKKMEGYKFKQCAFGENLFSIDKYKSAQMAFIVESEKTALICNIIYRNNPSFVWIASGGVQNLTDSALHNLQDKYLKLFPDEDGKGLWDSKMRQLINKGYNVQIIDWQKMFPIGTEVGAKDDVADIILRADRDSLLSFRSKIEEISCFS